MANAAGQTQSGNRHSRHSRRNAGQQPWQSTRALLAAARKPLVALLVVPVLVATVLAATVLVAMVLRREAAWGAGSSRRRRRRPR